MAATTFQARAALPAKLDHKKLQAVHCNRDNRRPLAPSNSDIPVAAQATNRRAATTFQARAALPAKLDHKKLQAVHCNRDNRPPLAPSNSDIPVAAQATNRRAALA